MQQQTPYRTKTEFSCWKNGELVSADRASVSVHDHGLLYGDGCFEGLRFYHGRPFMPDRHLARLRRSLQALAITIPYTDDTLTEAVMTCIRGSGMHDGYLRILVTRGEGDMGLDPRNCTRPNVFIIPAALSLVSDTARRQGICLITSSIRRATGTGLDARVKSLNYLHSVLARMQADAAGADEAILLNQSGYVAECSAENIFIVKEDKLLTPPVQDGALEGITREIILELAPRTGLEAQEQSLTSYDLYTADECFICGSGARLIPVRMIDGRPLTRCPGPVYQQILLAWQALIEEECGDPGQGRRNFSGNAPD
jgi:branched-chain amino acid aminotransferase